jgi:16S rRNA (guanine966-N2)-methyltransferase
MRIIGGQWRGRRLVGPQSETIRPTSDRLRETLFNILVHSYDDPVPEASVLDLCAGTGALGFEALSRGASHVLCVDEGLEARALISTNSEALGAQSTVQFLRRDVTRMGQALANQVYNLIFCDPPYGKGLAEKALLSCAQGGWLKPDALIVVEEAADAVFLWPPDFEECERRDYGDTQLRFGIYRKN